MHILFLLTLMGPLTFAQGTTPPEPERIHLLDVVTQMPKTAWESIEYSFSKESIPAWATIIGTTAVLYHYDEDLYRGAQADGRRWNLGNQDNTRTVLSGFGYDLVRLPSDTASGLYFLGDGWMHTMIGMGFLATGYFGDHNRAYNTGLEIFHGMVVSTLFNQALKRASGRESPNQESEERGRWRPFPSIPAYQAHTSTYDAFPSGHIMTATMTFTVIEENYSEYSAYIYPIEFLWLTALGFEMMNNGVHWASDYPLGIGMGYVVGKMSTHLAKSMAPPAAGGKEQASHWTIFPSTGPSGPELNVLYVF